MVVDPDRAQRLPCAPAYIAELKAACWRDRAIAVLRQNGGGARASNLLHSPQAPTAPINRTARAMRAHFGWN